MLGTRDTSAREGPFPLLPALLCVHPHHSTLPAPSLPTTALPHVRAVRDRAQETAPLPWRQRFLASLDGPAPFGSGHLPLPFICIPAYDKAPLYSYLLFKSAPDAEPRVGWNRSVVLHALEQQIMRGGFNVRVRRGL